MTDCFRKVLNVLNTSVFGNIADTDAAQPQDIYEIAIKQSVFPLVYGVMPNNNCDKKYERIFFMQVVQREQMLCCLKDVITLFDDNDINYCLLKGFTVGELYYKPEYRVSGDIDILIDEESEKKAMDLLSSRMNMKITPRYKSQHHFLAKHCSGVLLEVHIRLYGSTFDEIVLKNQFRITEATTQIKLNNEFYVNTLGLYDNLYFLTIHLIKHFVKEGCGIRQVTDLLVYVNAHKDKIDFDEYFRTLNAIKFDKLIKNILGIGVKYFNLSFPIYETEYADAILTDIEIGGSFGFSDNKRLGFFNNFILERTEKKRKKFIFERSLKQTKAILKGVFLPSKTFLINKGYKYLEKSILLYPVAYFNRIIDSIILLKKRGTKDFVFETSENSAINNRIELMKELHMIDD